jgi:hypothetical protein
MKIIKPNIKYEFLFKLHIFLTILWSFLFVINLIGNKNFLAIIDLVCAFCWSANVLISYKKHKEKKETAMLEFNNKLKKESWKEIEDFSYTYKEKNN